MRSRTIRACGEGRHRPTGPGLSGQKPPAAARPRRAQPVARRMALRGLSSAELTAPETVVLPAAAPLQLNAATRRYEDAFKLAQPPTIDLPRIQDQTVRLPLLEKKLSHACRISVDLDHLKQVNDTRGHAMGRHRGRPPGRSLKPRVSGTMGSTCAKASSRPVLSSWPFRKSASCRCLYQTRRIHRCHDTSGCSLAQRRHLPETVNADRCGRARRARAAGT